MIFSNKRKILMTGAAGKIGTVLREAFATEQLAYQVRALDVEPIHRFARSEQMYMVSILDRLALDKAMKGVDTVIHLAAIPHETHWQDILQMNYQGLYNVFESARAAKVKRIIFASSIHAVGFYGRSETVRIDSPVRPDCLYGVSKVFGEAVGRLYADKYGLSIVCLRICSFKKQPQEVRDLTTWLSERDAVQLFIRSIETPNIHFTIAYGISNNQRARLLNTGTAIQGYQPLDDAQTYAEQILQHRPSEPPPHYCYGGDFAPIE